MIAPGYLRNLWATVWDPLIYKAIFNLFHLVAHRNWLLKFCGTTKIYFFLIWQKIGITLIDLQRDNNSNYLSSLNVLLFTLLQLSQFIPFVPSTQPTHHVHSHSPLHCPCLWVLLICSLTNLFTFYQLVPTSPLLSYTVSLSPDSIPLVLFCSLVYFVH